MSRLLIVGIGPVAFYYGCVFLMYGYSVDHTIPMGSKQKKIVDKISVIGQSPEFKCLYKPNLVLDVKPWKYEYIIIACESKRARDFCTFLKDKAPPSIVLTSCWNSYHGSTDKTNTILWGFPRILCESTENCLKGISLGKILTDVRDVHHAPQKILTYKTLFKSIKIELQPVNLEYVYPYLFLLTTCMYTQLLNEYKGTFDKNLTSFNRQVMDDCYADAYILLGEKMKIAVNQAELEAGIPWNPKLLIDTASLFLQELKSSQSVTGWIINQLINHKSIKMHYFIKTILKDKNTTELKRLKLALLSALNQN